MQPVISGMMATLPWTAYLVTCYLQSLSIRLSGHQAQNAFIIGP